MKPSRIIVLRLDRDPLVCRERARLLRRFNPGVKICGIFGGGKGYKRAAFRLGGRGVLKLDDFYASRRIGWWNWKNGDLVLAAWYRDVGHAMAFDVVHFVEWDLVFLDSCECVYAGVPEGAVGLTALTPISEIDNEWEWVKGSRRDEWQRLLAYARAEWGYDEVPYRCLGPGPCLPRSFLARYAEVDPPEFGNDELRLPLFAQLLGYPLADTGFWVRSHDGEQDQLFNVGGEEIDVAKIRAELARPDGRRVFHPIRRRDPLRAD
jgi:hypothetical protein